MTFRFLHTLMIILATFGVVEPAAALRTGRDRVLKIDAVALIDQNKEIEGKIDFQQQQGKFNYLFASSENLATFKANPAKYEIQFGGACGRMGALSGEGSPKLFAVHDGRLYIFASEQCRRAFQSGPEKFLLTDDAPPQTTEDSLKRGKALLERATAGLRSTSQFQQMTTLREELARTIESSGKHYKVTESLVLKYPAARIESCWDDQCWSTCADDNAGWAESAGVSESLAASQIEEFWHGPARTPFVLNGRQNRSDFIATSNGEIRKVTVPGQGDVMLDILTIYCRKSLTTLGVDEAGRMVLMTYRGRGPSLTIGQIEKTYSDFQNVGGRLLPGRVDATFDGKPDAEHSGAIAYRINAPSDDQLFKRPEERKQE